MVTCEVVMYHSSVAFTPTLCTTFCHTSRSSTPFKAALILNNKPLSQRRTPITAHHMTAQIWAFRDPLSTFKSDTYVDSKHQPNVPEAANSSHLKGH